ncbi:Aste57867_10769 [Aphanomyces stellatus]|uniref:Aste57867_10769 protein n=1 Tax=Aphanomyces stellatus TaxID=120398 RepID=A0A485KSV2_9STRA|nr:hypothetical protein As57867_010729 [Aphanomyces stellatus]VFT87639.1 Aste57867_10769 [Aphanomyces stellatus]
MVTTTSTHQVPKTRMAFLLNPVPRQLCDTANSVLLQPSSANVCWPSMFDITTLLNHHEDEADPPLMPPSPLPPWKMEPAVQELISVALDQQMPACLDLFLLPPKPHTHRSLCQVDGCSTAAVTKGRCVRHGGGTRCVEPGCNKRTKRFRRCFLHGGFVYCNIEGCASKAKRFGRCWAHGGGSLCAESGCEKLAVKSGLCWTHGGGNRCRVEDCWRRSYKRCDFYCDEHFRVVQAGQHSNNIVDGMFLC